MKFRFEKRSIDTLHFICIKEALKKKNKKEDRQSWDISFLVFNLLCRFRNMEINVSILNTYECYLKIVFTVTVVTSYYKNNFKVFNL